jgi:hypothetical protein
MIGTFSRVYTFGVVLQNFCGRPYCSNLGDLASSWSAEISALPTRIPQITQFATKKILHGVACEGYSGGSSGGCQESRIDGPGFVGALFISDFPVSTGP